jgi:hypothetical protein
VDFCREFGRNAISEMAWLMAEIVRTNIRDELKRGRLLEELRETGQWTKFVCRAAGATAGKPEELDWFEVFPWDRATGAVPVQRKTEEPPGAPQPVVPALSTEREIAGDPPEPQGAAKVKAFIAHAEAEGYKITREHILMVANQPKGRRSLENFQYHPDRVSSTTIQKYERILQMPIAEFIAELNKRLQRKGSALLKPE